MFSHLPSDKKIGIIGSGQLGLMIVLEGIRLGLRFNVLGNCEDYICNFAKCYDNTDMKKFLDESEIITFEFEQGNENAMVAAEDMGKLVPNYKSVWLKVERDREKNFLASMKLPVPRFRIAENGKDAISIVKDEFNGIAVLKKVKGGYDGKGQYYVKDDKLFPEIEKINEKIVVEEFINYDYESSIIITRSRDEILNYPVTYNFNKEGILIYNYGPIEDKGEVEIAKKLSRYLDYIGTMGVEFFVVDGKVLINEFSPRVHNSGHYTIDSALTSQFENHLRAILNLPLGPTKTLDYFGMVNVLGKSNLDSKLLKIGKLNWYFKENTNPRRKVGHIDVSGNSLKDVCNKIDIIIKALYPDNFKSLRRDIV